MSNLSIVWNQAEARGDWQVQGGRLLTGHPLRSAVLISLFTDRRALDDGAAAQDPRGWWQDSFDSVPIGSRLWQLRRRKVADRAQLVLDATDICREALQWLIDDGLAASVDIDVTVDPTASGTVLGFAVRLHQPNGAAPLIRALWRAETGDNRR